MAAGCREMVEMEMDRPSRLSQIETAEIERPDDRLLLLCSAMLQTTFPHTITGVLRLHSHSGGGGIRRACTVLTHPSQSVLRQRSSQSFGVLLELSIPFVRSPHGMSQIFQWIRSASGPQGAGYFFCPYFWGWVW